MFLVQETCDMKPAQQTWLTVYSITLHYTRVA